MSSRHTAIPCALYTISHISPSWPLSTMKKCLPQGYYYEGNLTAVLSHGGSASNWVQVLKSVYFGRRRLGPFPSRLPAPSTGTRVHDLNCIGQLSTGHSPDRHHCPLRFFRPTTLLERGSRRGVRLRPWGRHFSKSMVVSKASVRL